MGFDTMIQSDGSWRLGNSNVTTYLKSFTGRPAQFTGSGSATLGNTTWIRVFNTNVLDLNTIYLMDFEWGSSGAPWRYASAFLYTTCAQNGDCYYEHYLPCIVHADNGLSLNLAFRAGYGAGGVTSGLEFRIVGNPGLAGSFTCYAYNMGTV